MAPLLPQNEFAGMPGFGERCRHADSPFSLYDRFPHLWHCDLGIDSINRLLPGRLCGFFAACSIESRLPAEDPRLRIREHAPIHQGTAHPFDRSLFGDELVCDLRRGTGERAKLHRLFHFLAAISAWAFPLAVAYSGRDFQRLDGTRGGSLGAPHRATIFGVRIARLAPEVIVWRRGFPTLG